MTRIKICGITREQDALAAAAAGADAIGLVFYAPSPRAVDAAQAARIVAALPPFVTTVGLFVDAEPAAVRAVLAEVPLDLLQFHGEESDDYCRQFGRPYLKAVRVRSADQLQDVAAQWPGAAGILLDSYKPGVPGGTGEVFDWRLVPRERDWNLVLAGGLAAGNVRQAIDEMQPWAVDVSGGVEAAKGIKDVAKINAFVQEVKRV
ncbi:N-(5'-phosphoribosyl)anthranilate isomerase [Halopseudomonas pachastrellae]|uniref:N-(5'-phosphoribosyl)anthranilate isomerase n=2 Tax=Halopseudomonas pachastrellae TaxID=254161 RepID=A0A1S8DD39_9GAMM|nr:phosphoribosylanthranilate isomerase [Halopseudomonas pachastrellae]MAB40825.1 phosphoribosylanthranilate isomerase [Pseudomonadales bacterium]HCB42738.1 phosphoribosylanthranilate isomerase [Pseudomonas sp.]ONM43324.1 N-(5'-phosphoribosyl)anthranilate isomerase [Halopseudomonas pachastrellae]SFM58452.1 phosphoribosylanthranilate isomerase [Halopseudomonas pachastrellae]HCL40700.1 phosphoribosylanthranilate isomerase [Pseudomonas sp.]|tara:strand:- start:179 stop:793 length:615 start_codon:yes stop_codon:yes gene_type:complete